MKLTLLHIFFLGLISFGGYPLSSQNHSPNVKAWVDIQKNGPMLVVEAHVENLTSCSQELRYKLETRKIGVSGSNSTFQKGSCKIDAHQSKVLSQSRFNANPSDKYNILLLVYKHSEVVARDSVFYNGEIH